MAAKPHHVSKFYNRFLNEREPQRVWYIGRSGNKRIRKKKLMWQSPIPYNSNSILI